MSAEHDASDDGGLNTLQSRRSLLKAGGAALATAGLAGCTKYATSGGEDGDGTTPHPNSAEAQEYQCRDDVYTANIVARRDTAHAHPDRGEDYVPRLAKQAIESEMERIVNLEQSDQYTDYKVFIDPELYWSDHSDSFALFEAPYFDADMTERYEAGDEMAHHANILLRNGGGSSLLGLAVTDFSPDMCDTDTQACIVNYANLLGDYDQKEDRSIDDEWIPLIVDNEVKSDLLANAVVTTPGHEGYPGHLGYMAHPDGVSRVVPNDELDQHGLEAGDRDVWWSSSMGSFYSIPASIYGLANSCGKDFEAPEFMSAGMETIWEDDLYFRNRFTDCAVEHFLNAADLDAELGRRSPRFNRVPDYFPDDFRASGAPAESAGNAMEVWRQHPAVQAEEERLGVRLDELWEDFGLADRQISANNLAKLQEFASYAPTDGSSDEMTADDAEKAQRAILDFHSLFANEVAGEAGQYVSHPTRDTGV